MTVRTTLFLRADGSYEHLLLEPDGEMSIQNSGIEPHHTEVQISVFSESRVDYRDGEFTVAEGERAKMVADVLAESLDLIDRGQVPPVFTFDVATSR